MATLCGAQEFWYDPVGIDWPGGEVGLPALPPSAPVAAAEWGWMFLSLGLDPCADGMGGTGAINRVVYHGWNGTPGDTTAGDYYGMGDHNVYDGSAGPWTIPPCQCYAYAWGATYSASDTEPPLPPYPGVAGAGSLLSLVNVHFAANA